MKFVIKIPPMVFLIHGEDDFLASEKLIFLKNGSLKKYGDFNVVVFNNEAINVESIINEINSLPFLGEKRVVILENILTSLKKEERKRITECATNSPETTVIIFFENKDLLPYKAKDRIKDIEDFMARLDKKNIFSFSAMDIGSLGRWIATKLKSQGFSIDTRAINGLVALIGNNTRQIDNEIKKLSAYKFSEKAINADDVVKLVKANVDTNIFTLTDALAKKDVRTAQKILRNIIDSGEETYGVLSMIAFQFRNLLLIKIAETEKVPQQKFLSDTRMNPYVHKKTSGQTRSFTLDKLKEIYHLIFETDLAIKTGTKDPETALDLLIVKICS